MAHYTTTLLNDLEESILKVLEISRTELCTVHFGIKGHTHFATFRFPDGGRAECISTQDDGLVFAGGSLFKVFIATAASLMIEKFSSDPQPTNRYRGLRGAWKRTFTEVFNEFSKDSQIRPLDGNPTVLDLILHFKGPCDINHLLFSPQGTPLLTESNFLSTIPKYTEDTRQRHDNTTTYCEYSNSNYILISLLIQAASGMSLHAFLKEHIFNRLGMHRTYMTAGELNSIAPGLRAQPHLVSGDGTRRPIVFDTIPYLADTVEVATTGGYICAADVGIFFQAVQDALNGTSAYGEFDAKFAKSLFLGLGAIDSQEHHGYTRFGLYTRLDENLPGSHSLNRLISPESDSSTFTLMETFQDNTISAYYMAGAVNGWACTAYFLPTKERFVVVLTNTSSPLDSSDIISRLCLQEMLRLKPSKFGSRNFSCRPNGWERMTAVETYRAHYVELAARMYEENAKAFRKLEEEDKAPDTLVADCPKVCGIYTNESSGQTLNVIDSKLGPENVLRVIMRGKPKKTEPMRFVYKGKVFRICSLGFPGLGIDCFGDWRNLEFEFTEENGIVTSLSRKGVNLVDRFIRMPD